MYKYICVYIFPSEQCKSPVDKFSDIFLARTYTRKTLVRHCCCLFLWGGEGGRVKIVNGCKYAYGEYARMFVFVCDWRAYACACICVRMESMRVCVYMHVYTYVCICVQMESICMCVHMCANGEYARMSVYVRIHICTCMCAIAEHHRFMCVYTYEVLFVCINIMYYVFVYACAIA